VSTAADLKALTVKQLAQMAKCRGIPGWHSMRKEELIKALLKVLRAESKRLKVQSSNRLTRNSVGLSPPTTKPSMVKRNGSQNGKKAGLSTKQRRVDESGGTPWPVAAGAQPVADPKNLASNHDNGRPVVDRIVLMVRDPYWLHAFWELNRQTIERARVALGQHWHLARPILRLIEIDPEATGSADRRVVRDIEIHGAVSNWYIDVTDPPRTLQVDIGYLGPGNKFLCLARSNVVTTRPGTASHWWPAMPGSSGPAHHLAEWDRVFALSTGEEVGPDQNALREFLEDHLDQPLGGGLWGRFGAGAQGDDAQGDLPLEIDAELVVYGFTVPGARVTVRGEPVEVRPDGTFTVRYGFPDRRQVLPVVASSRDGSQQRTILLAVERNTKVMEPVLREAEVT